MSDTTKGKPSKNGKIINQCKINDFNAMIEETLQALEKVLEQREKDLNNWGGNTTGRILRNIRFGRRAYS